MMKEFKWGRVVGFVGRTNNRGLMFHSYHGWYEGSYRFKLIPQIDIAINAYNQIDVTISFEWLNRFIGLSVRYPRFKTSDGE